MKSNVIDQEKHLRTLINKYRNEQQSIQLQIDAINSEINFRKDDIRQKRDKINVLEYKIKQNEDIIRNTNKEIRVTEHAILRYCERVLKINVEEIKNKIMKEEDKIRLLGGNTKIKKDNYSIVVKDYNIVTVV